MTNRNPHRWPIAWLVLTGCAPTVAPAQQHEARSAEAVAPQAAAADPGDTWIVGVLGQVGRAHCPTPDEQQWLDVEEVIGWTHVTLPSPDDALLGQPVVARGTVIAAPPSAPSTTVAVECPLMQMRSDWVDTPLGMRVRRERHSPPAHLRIAELRPLAELHATRVDADVVIELRNPVPVELRDVMVVVHYEGCHGKPGTARREHAIGTLAVGAGTRVRLPAMVQAERAPGVDSPHRASTVQVLAVAEHAYFDLDVPLATLGVESPCPDRG